MKITIISELFTSNKLKSRKMAIFTKFSNKVQIYNVGHFGVTIISKN